MKVPPLTGRDLVSGDCVQIWDCHNDYGSGHLYQVPKRRDSPKKLGE